MMMMIIIVIITAIMIMMIKTIIIAGIIINNPFQPGNFSTGSTIAKHPYKSIFAFALKVKTFVIASLLLFFTTCDITGDLEQKKYFTDHATANTVQLLVAIKENAILFLNESQRR